MSEYLDSKIEKVKNSIAKYYELVDFNNKLGVSFMGNDAIWNNYVELHLYVDGIEVEVPESVLNDLFDRLSVSVATNLNHARIKIEKEMIE